MTLTADIYFGGHALVLDASGALWWPAERILVASDLHFEKATYHGQLGALLAPYDTLDTLERLEKLIAAYQPRELVLLGDSFHDAGAWNRLDASLRARIQALGPCRWIEGNHDVRLNGDGVPPFESDFIHAGIRFTHDDIQGDLPHILGHYHPKARISLQNRTASGRCFAHTSTRLVMPAFGSFTGGLDIRHEAFKAVFEAETPHCHLLYQHRIYSLPA